MTSVVTFKDVRKIYRQGAERVNIRAALPGRLGRTVPEGGHAALDGVTFALEPGEILGIIGPNGAGKSTALKLVARVIAPTSGRVWSTGRLASLIELGVGFHPDLTGAENIRFSAAILGMSRSEVRSRYDEIIDFAGVGSFIDTPVKRYSSGMLARLGFAVASHLDADVLVIDEVLAAGDAAFQRKSYDRMRQLRSSGASVMIVTHALWLIPELCQRAIRLDKGHIVDEGNPRAVVESYQASAHNDPGQGGLSSDAIAVRRLTVLPADVEPGGSLEIAFTVDVLRPIPNCRLNLVLATTSDLAVAGMDVPTTDARLGEVGRREVTCRIDDIRLRPGLLRVYITIVEEDQGPVVHAQAVANLHVTGVEEPLQWYGVTDLRPSWSVRQSPLSA